jgi:hypothetical protein
VFSRDWNFSIVNRGRLNAQGYVNDHDYDRNDPVPLLALVGDSMIEALMVPFNDTVQGRLARELEGRLRVYSFAFSGAPLSQYLAWAKHAVETYHASALAIFVMSNDFDESIDRFAGKPGFYQYAKDDGDSWIWIRHDYAPSAWLDLVNTSSLLQYLYRNVRITTTGPSLRNVIAIAFGRGSDKAESAKKVRNRAAGTADQEKLLQSQQIVDRFLHDLVVLTRLPPSRILFVIDGQMGRVYRGLPRDNGKDYGAKMLSYFIVTARAQGFEVVDMHEVFEAEFAANHHFLQFPTDSHWNSYAHGVAARAVANSKLVRDLTLQNTENAQSRP